MRISRKNQQAITDAVRLTTQEITDRYCPHAASKPVAEWSEHETETFTTVNAFEEKCIERMERLFNEE